MAVDEALLESASITRQPTLRFYSWAEPTLSLGYFQRFEDRSLHQASCECPVVRRTSGGGAIIHDRELTYSFCVPVGDRVSDDLIALYRNFHETLVRTLNSFNVIASMYALGGSTGRQHSFLCFQRRADGDVIINERKIAGSAQRRHKGAVLQHGSVLLSSSRNAPELPGIKEISGVALDVNTLAANWTKEIAQTLQIRLEKSSLTASEERLACQRQNRKFTNDLWTKRR